LLPIPTTRLLYIYYTMMVVFCFDNGDRDARLIVEKVVGLLGFSALNRFTANDDTALREIDLFPKLGQQIPLADWTDQCGGYELGADVRFGESFFIHRSFDRGKIRGGI
jgi:hypothetical protein